MGVLPGRTGEGEGEGVSSGVDNPGDLRVMRPRSPLALERAVVLARAGPPSASRSGRCYEPPLSIKPCVTDDGRCSGWESAGERC